MAKDLRIEMEDQPGTLAEAAEALGKAGINIEGGMGTGEGGKGTGHFLVEDTEAARMALEAVGATVTAETDVLVLSLNDRPGELGSVARKIADAGVNVTLMYLATNTRLVLGVDDLEKARAAIG